MESAINTTELNIIVAHTFSGTDTAEPVISTLRRQSERHCGAVVRLLRSSLP
jgi:hypothetical protein